MGRERTTVLVAVLATAAICIAYVAWGGAAGLEPIRAVPAALAALAVTASAARSRPARPLPWAVLAIGFVVMAAATVAQSVAMHSDDIAFPGHREAVLLLAYPAVFAGMLGLTSPHRHTRDPLAGSEPLVYAIAATALVWVAVTGPYVDDRGMPLTSSAWVWIFPCLDLTLAMLTLRRMKRTDGRFRFELMMLGFIQLAAGHAVLGWAGDEGQLQPGSWYAIAPVFGVMLIAAGLRVPDSPRRDVDDRPVSVHRGRVAGLIAATVVVLATFSVVLVTGVAPRSSTVAAFGATVAVMVLVLLRMWSLVRQVSTQNDSDGRDRLAAMVEHSSDVVLLTDASGVVNYVSPGVLTMLGRMPETWMGCKFTDIMVESDRESARQEFDRVLADGQGGTVEFEIGLTHTNGELRRATIVAANLIGGTAVDGVVVTIRDVTEQRDLERQLSHRAFHDELTGLANRALFLDRMDHALRVERSEIDPVVVLFVDLDDFKSVNDELGHVEGDEVLRRIADRIRRAAGAGDTPARLGGDEFALLLEDRGGVDRAIGIAERLLDEFHEPILLGSGEATVLASIGVAVATGGMVTTSLLRDADIAMYEAKRAGKGQIRIFDPSMRLAASKHLAYRADLAGAIERDELRLVFQPYVDLATGRVVGAEALMRWHHPQRGDLPPTDFLPVAERSGLIVQLGEWVIEHALAEAGRWRPGLLIGMNVSPAQIRHEGFVSCVLEHAADHGVDPSAVVIEFTEALLADGDELIAATLGRLREAGFRFAVDDFGTGECSLAVLQRHPIDLLKIDRSAVHSFGDEPLRPSLARTILRAAASLGISTVAEGIETTAQLHELRRAGCTFGQGFLLSRPLESAELETRFGYSDPLAV